CLRYFLVTGVQTCPLPISFSGGTVISPPFAFVSRTSVSVAPINSASVLNLPSLLVQIRARHVGRHTDNASVAASANRSNMLRRRAEGRRVGAGTRRAQ